MDKEEALSITKREIIAEIIDRRIEIILAPYNYPECYCYLCNKVSSGENFLIEIHKRVGSIRITEGFRVHAKCYHSILEKVLSDAFNPSQQ